LYLSNTGLSGRVGGARLLVLGGKCDPLWQVTPRSSENVLMKSYIV